MNESRSQQTSTAQKSNSLSIVNVPIQNSGESSNKNRGDLNGNDCVIVKFSKI